MYVYHYTSRVHIMFTATFANELFNNHSEKMEYLLKEKYILRYVSKLGLPAKGPNYFLVLKQAIYTWKIVVYSVNDEK